MPTTNDEAKKVIWRLTDGRTLVTTQKEDQYWVMYPDGTKKRLTLQQACILIQRESVEPDDESGSKPIRKRRIVRPRPKNRRVPSERISQEDLRDVAVYLLLHDPDGSEEFRSVNQVTFEEINGKMNEILKKLDPDDTGHEDQLCLHFFREVARLWRQHLSKLDKEAKWIRE